MKSRAIFIDTSAWYALADVGDTYHGQASRYIQRLVDERRPLITTNYIASETYTLLRVRLGFPVAQEFLRRTRSSPLTERVFVPDAWEKAAERLLTQYRDHPFSFVDATSFVAMQRLGLQQALAFDHHFVILGFTLVGDSG